MTTLCEASAQECTTDTTGPGPFPTVPAPTTSTTVPAEPTIETLPVTGGDAVLSLGLAVGLILGGLALFYASLRSDDE